MKLYCIPVAYLAAVALVSVGLMTCVRAQDVAPSSAGMLRATLPQNVVPVQYAAHLTLNIGNNTFLGAETVEIEVLAPTSAIVLHAVDLDIDGATLASKQIGERKLTPLLDAAQQTLTFQLEQPLAPGRYALALKFHGQIKREARGLFYVPYKVGGQDKVLLATSMAPNMARRLLPSWDAPAFRATFKLTVDAPAKLKVFSNTPIERQERLESGLQRTWFGVTPKMPSSRLALVVGELERLSAKQDGVDLGVVTSAGKLAAAAYPLAAIRDVLRYYNSYLGLPYPLAKLDQIAIPGGVRRPAENWGAIVDGDGSLLVDAAGGSDATRQLSFGASARSLARQWFGNLVSMARPEDRWLDEALASWLAAKASEQLHPEWRSILDDQAERENLFNDDAAAGSGGQPLQGSASAAQAAGEVDTFSEGKGAALLRMLEAYLGEDAFRKGVRAYIAKHKYANSTSADLWAALTAASGKPVEQLAADWATQRGVPLITVKQSCKDGKREVRLSQAPLQSDTAAGGDGATEALRRWRIPLVVGTVDGPSSQVLLGSAGLSLQQPCERALVVDPAAVGYFRVQYDDASFDALARQVTRLPDSTRLKLQADAWAMVMGERLSLARYLGLIEQYGKENRGAVWRAILANLATLDMALAGTPEQARLQRWVVALMRPKFDSLGWDERSGEPVDERQLRALLAITLARNGDAAVLAEARLRVARAARQGAASAPSMAETIVNTAARSADLLTARAQAASADAVNTRAALTARLLPQLRAALQ